MPCRARWSDGTDTRIPAVHAQLWGMNMTLRRRRFLSLAASAAALPLTSRIASAEAFPARPVHMIVGFSSGGAGDLTARLIGQALQERLGQPVIIENRPGAGGNIGTEAVVRAAADGYTLIWAGANHAINATLYTNLKYNFIRDIAPVAGVMRGPLVMVVHPSIPVTTVTEFIAYAKANPGKVNFPSPGNGSTAHLAGELFKMIAGVEMVHIPYRNDGTARADLMAGQVQVMFANVFTVIGHVRDGQLRALAITTAARSLALPGLPTVADTVPGFEASAWFGVGAPKATPADVIAILNKEINACLAEPGLTARLAELGNTPLLFSPAEFGAHIAAETDKWGKVVKFSGAKMD
jgi:tripartite-type tricarboxylate transporter receptor subunit TctC